MSQAVLPTNFLWGFATASYQVEGAISKDGREPSIWETFCAQPGKIADGSSGEIACDSYCRASEDIELLKKCGAKAYRFSLSWSRIIPLGGRDDPVNHVGLFHYVQFIDDILAAGIIPIVTLYHWDLPAELDSRYGGLLSKAEFTADFERYASVCFAALPKVKHWITFNEPFCSAILGYNFGIHAPGRTSNRTKNPVGNSSTEPWIVGHNLLIAHGKAVALYRSTFQEASAGEIGITLNGDWAEPFDDTSSADHAACQRRLEFWISWFADPIYFGDYPTSMRAQLGSRLPEFTDQESALLKGSNDFYGMNHYCAAYIKDRSHLPAELDDFVGNVIPDLYTNSKGESIGPETQSPWLHPNAPAFRKLLNWISNRYSRSHPDFKIYVTENGTSIKGENDLSTPEILEDDFRAKYFTEYISSMCDAVREDGVNVRMYMAWSLMDNFEWAEGYETRFGVCYVDYENGQKRVLKRSARVVRELFGRFVMGEEKDEEREVEARERMKQVAAKGKGLHF